MTPGPDTALVIRNGLRGGRKSALLTSLGVVSGLLVWTVAAAVGVAFLLSASASAFLLLKLAGAACHQEEGWVDRERSEDPGERPRGRGADELSVHPRTLQRHLQSQDRDR